MQNNNGWIKVYRQLLDNPVVCKDSNHLAVWMYLLLNATHTDFDMMFKGKRITLKPGQLITGRKSISEKLVISCSMVQRILKMFEIEHQIEQQGSNRNRLISILNWNEYQQVEQPTEQPSNNKRTTDEHLANTNKNIRIKELKNVKKDSNDIVGKPPTEKFIKPTLEQVKDYCRERKNTVDPESWIDHYISNGWLVGNAKAPMKDWKAAVRTWEKGSNKKPEDKKFSERSYKESDIEDLYFNPLEVKK
jgi:hypothetical protein